MGSHERTWRFGDAEFDPAQGILTVGGRAVEIDRNCAAVLTLLLEEAGRDVAKQRLLRAGWPDRMVHENSLAKAISRLRQALGEQGNRLESAYGFGYRLTVEFAPCEDEAPVEADAGAAPSAARRPVLLALCALLALVGAAAIAWWTMAGAGGETAFRDAPPKIGDAPDTVRRVLWVDDHPENNVHEKQYFEDHRVAVHNVTSSVDAFRLLAMYDYDLVISDMGRGDDRLAGIKLVEQMRARGDRTPLIIYTVRLDGAEAQRAQRQMVTGAGAQGVAVTPQEARSVVLAMLGNPARRPPR